MSRTFTRILVPTDFSETADAALDYAKGLATRLGASLHLLYVFSDLYAAATMVPETTARIFSTRPSALSPSGAHAARWCNASCRDKPTSRTASYVLSRCAVAHQS